ncbi:phosphotransferase-like protein [Bacillus sp. AK128]
MNQGKIIVLNGVSSSGKSTLSKKLLSQLKDYYHLSIDEFDKVIEVMEERGIENGRLIPVPTEFLFHDNIKMFSDYGVNLIVDQILFNKETMDDFLTKLHKYPILFVGVYCFEEEINRRELQRENRTVGQGKSQLQFVHQQNEVYDVSVRTDIEPLELCVENIISGLQNIDNLNGVKETYNKWSKRIE